MHHTSRGSLCALVLLASAAPGSSLTAQQILQPRSSIVLDGAWIDRLPVDRIEDALVFEPGVVVTRSGRLSLRGGGPDDFNVFLDGFSIRPGYQGTGGRLSPGFVINPPAIPARLGTNAVERLELTTGPLPATLGNTQSGVIALETRRGGPTFSARGTAETDALFGDLNGPGFNRFEGVAGGRVGARFRLFGAVMLEGRHAVDLGPGAENAPVFDLAGVDTTVGVPSAIFDPLADTTFVDVTAFAVTRGQCDAFSASTNQNIADNYGRGCQGVQTPVTGSGTYSLAARVDFALSSRGELSLTGLASQDQERFFSYRDLYNPTGLTASRGWSRIVNLSWRQELGSAQPLTLRLGGSLQRDRAMSGPLTTKSELDSRSTFGGLLLSPLDFRFDFENFPVDETLVNNYQQNIPGSRRTPYDLDNVDQYNYIDNYRNSPYGTGQFIDGGGPITRITLRRENRNIGLASLGWSWASHSTLEAGAVLTRYSVANYSGQLNTLIQSDVWIEKPAAEALYLQNTFHFKSGLVTAGIRYDHFSSHADRPFVLDTIASSPTFNRYSYFPTPNSYGTGGVTFQGQPLVKFVEDAGHGAMAARIQAAFELNPATALRAGYARENQMPDLGALLQGINTDLRVTSTNQVFGTDMSFQTTALYEVGLNRLLRPGLTLDLAVYERDLDHQPIAQLVPEADPARAGNTVDIREFTDAGTATVKGIEFRLDGRLGPVQGTLGYSYQDAHVSDDTPANDSRPHTVAGLLLLDVPDSWQQGKLLGSIFHSVGVSAGFRYSSGAPYTRCAISSGNESVLAGDPCVSFIAGSPNDTRLPAFKQLDLRITKGFRVAKIEMAAYLDGRNILNFRNIVNVFATTGKTSNQLEFDQVVRQDSASWANEAQQNGLWSFTTGDIDLNFSGAVASGCGNYVNSQNQPAAPSCVYLIRAEERFGDGDHVFSLAEQRRASSALYDVARGSYLFHSTPRRLRIGLELRF